MIKIKAVEGKVDISLRGGVGTLISECLATVTALAKTADDLAKEADVEPEVRSVLVSRVKSALISAVMFPEDTEVMQKLQDKKAAEKIKRFIMEEIL